MFFKHARRVLAMLLLSLASHLPLAGQAVASGPQSIDPALRVGLIASARGSAYGYGGVHLPVPLPLGLLARPSFSVGLYEKGQGVELGGVLEFRSSLVLERAVSERIRISAMLFHLSNAGLGLENPGMEAIGFAVVIPLPDGGR